MTVTPGVAIDQTKVGVHPNPEGGFATDFGIYLPNITYAKGYQVLIRIIHENDRALKLWVHFCLTSEHVVKLLARLCLSDQSWIYGNIG